MSIFEVIHNGRHVGFVEWKRNGPPFGDGWHATDGFPHSAIRIFEKREDAEAYLIERYEERRAS